jgi:hypothetical protein
MLSDGRAGGWRWTDTDTGEETASIGYRVTDECGSLFVALIYSTNGQSINDRIRIERTSCN